MEMIEDYLSELSLDELTRLYIESSDSGNKFSKELVNIVKEEHQFLYGKKEITYLDDSQLADLNKRIVRKILNNLTEDYILKNGEKM